jgi:hypothetical protein
MAQVGATRSKAAGRTVERPSAEAPAWGALPADERQASTHGGVERGTSHENA